MNSLAALQKLKGFLPEPSFVMAKKSQSPIAAQPATTTHTLHLNEATVKPDAGTVASVVSLFGDSASELLFIIERGAAGPFEGKAGQLLQKMIEAMGVRHTSVLMAVVDPATAMKDQWAEIQAKAVKAKIVITLGESLAQKLLQSKNDLASMRGVLHPFSVVNAKPKLIASFHPADLIANPALKKEAWEDLKIAVKELNLKLPPKGV